MEITVHCIFVLLLGMREICVTDRRLPIQRPGRISPMSKGSGGPTDDDDSSTVVSSCILLSLAAISNPQHHKHNDGICFREMCHTVRFANFVSRTERRKVSRKVREM